MVKGKPEENFNNYYKFVLCKIYNTLKKKVSIIQRLFSSTLRVFFLKMGILIAVIGINKLFKMS